MPVAPRHPLISLDWLKSHGHSSSMADSFNFGWFKLRKEIKAARSAMTNLTEIVGSMEEDHSANVLKIRDVERELELYFKGTTESTDPKVRELELEFQRLTEWIDKVNEDLDNQRAKRENRTNDLSLLEGIRNGVYRVPGDYTTAREAGELVNTEAKRARHIGFKPIRKKERRTQDIPIGGSDDDD